MFDVPYGTISIAYRCGVHSIILPLKRLSLPVAVTQQPIPTLSNRQFVVSKEKLSATEEQVQRELFWYREHLFKSLKAHWREVSGTLPLMLPLILKLFVPAEQRKAW